MTTASPIPIPITVLGGYLGAGKTTLLNSLLRRVHDRRLGIVVNDFGELGIDAALLDAARTDRTNSSVGALVNLANGCVCCTLGDDLRSTLDELAASEPRLDQIVVEASGVADPRATAAWGTVPGFAPGGTIVLAAADSVRRSARDRYVGSEVIRQLNGADLVVVTKSDRCAESEVADVVAWLATQSAAPCVIAPFGDLPLDLVLGRSGSEIGAGEVESGAPSSAHGAYARWSFDVAGPVDTGRLDRFLESLPDDVLRMKGFVDARAPSGGVQPVVVQVVGKTVSRVATAHDGARGLEAIGVAGVFDPSSLDALAAEYFDVR